MKARLRWLFLGASLAFVILGAPFSAVAALGGSLDSIHSEQLQMKANVTTIDADAYVVHEMKSATGTIVREYISSNGTVFGVTWQGPFIPDMRQLLGGYFDQYSHAAKVQRESHVGRRPLNIQEDGLVVQTAGHMRAFSGRAYDPRLLPVGVSENDIQ